jgi:hypothetical protein
LGAGVGSAEERSARKSSWLSGSVFHSTCPNQTMQEGAFGDFSNLY